MPRGAKPGERRGGRQKGAQNKAKANRVLAIHIAGIEPKAFLLNGLGFYQAIIEAEIAKGAKADRAKVAEAYATGKEFAKDAAPYCHSRKGSIEHSGSVGNYDITKLNDADLAKLRDILEPVAAAPADQGRTGEAGS